VPARAQNPFIRNSGGARPANPITLCATHPRGCFALASRLATFVIMATRVRYDQAQQTGVPSSRSGAGRQATSANRSAGTPRRRPQSGNQRKRPNQSRNQRRNPPRGKPRPRRRPQARPADPVVVLIGWIGRVIAGAWMMAAGAVGFAARAVGRGARDLEPHHRRDGLGLLTLGVAIVLAGGLWMRMDNAAGHAIRQVVTGGFGSLAFLAPALIALLAWRFLRHPDRNQATRRAALGWLGLLLGLTGLLEVAKGSPRPSRAASGSSRTTPRCSAPAASAVTGPRRSPAPSRTAKPAWSRPSASAPTTTRAQRPPPWPRPPSCPRAWGHRRPPRHPNPRRPMARPSSSC